MHEVFIWLMDLVFTLMLGRWCWQFFRQRMVFRLRNPFASNQPTVQKGDKPSEVALPPSDKRSLAATSGANRQATLRKQLLVVVGPDPNLHIDLAVFRKVRTHTQLHFTRLMKVTTTHFERYLERARMAQLPVRYLHLAVHANANFVEFTDRAVDGLWLSERLQDVEVLLLAGCQGDMIGDLLGVVPYVVTVMEEISHHHAMLLAESFWTEIALDIEPVQAFYNALDRCPSVVSEFAQLHT